MKLFKAFERFTVFVVSFFILISPISISADTLQFTYTDSLQGGDYYILASKGVRHVFIKIYISDNIDYINFFESNGRLRLRYSDNPNVSTIRYCATDYLFFDTFSVLASNYDLVYFSYPYDDNFPDNYVILASSIDIYKKSSTVHEKIFSSNISQLNSYFDENIIEEEEPEAPDYDSWAEKIFGEITSWFSGVLETLATPFTAVAEGLSGVWQAVKNVPQAIADKLEYLFVPSSDKFDELKDKFDEKFGFVGQIIDLGETIVDATFGGSKPNSNITVYGGTYTIIDWDIYDDYRPYIHGIIVLLSYIVFIPKLIKRLPSVIRGI